MEGARKKDPNFFHFIFKHMNDYNCYEGKMLGYLDNEDLLYIPTNDNFNFIVISSKHINTAGSHFCKWEWDETERGCPIVIGGFEVYDKNFSLGVNYHNNKLSDIVYNENKEPIYYCTGSFSRIPGIFNSMKLCEVTVEYWGSANITEERFKSCKIVDKIYIKNFKVVEEDETIKIRLREINTSEIEYKIKKKKKLLESINALKDCKKKPGKYSKQLLDILEQNKKNNFLEICDEALEIIEKKFKEEITLEIKQLENDNNTGSKMV